MAMTAFHAPHLLILDEPTNHLDIDSREALIHALAEYEGAVILISPDRHLGNASADRRWIVKGGTVRAYDGDMESYRGELLAERGGRAKERNGGAAALSDGDARATRADQRRDAAERRIQLAPLKKAMQAAEKQVDKMSGDIARLDAVLADPALYAKDAGKAKQLTLDRGQLAKSLAGAEESWLAATEAYEAAAGGE